MSSLQFTVGLLYYKIIGWICTMFFLGCSIGAYRDRQYGPIAIFMFFVIIGASLIVNSGLYVISNDSINHRTMLGSFRILWKNVRKIEVGMQGTLVLHGDNQRFVLAPPSFWSGRDKHQAYELLAKKIEDLGIRTYESFAADYKTHKNVRSY